MSHFAQVKDGIVQQVLSAEQDFIDTLPDASDWIKASYNTLAGVHLLGGEPLRKNYPGIGWTYDSLRDAFYTPQPGPDYILNEDSCVWEKI